MQSQDSITKLPGVGDALARVLARLHLSTVQDLLFHLPLRYLDRTRVAAIGRLGLNQSVVLEGEVASAQVLLGRKRSLVVNLKDDTGVVCLRFFHFNAAQKAAFKEGARLRCYGDTRLGRHGLELYHPEYEFLRDGRPSPLAQTLTPVYPLTEGITQARMRKLVLAAVARLNTEPPAELLPPEFNRKFQVESLSQALAYLHQPPADAPIQALMDGHHPFQQRLAFEELLAHHLTLKRSRAKVQAQTAPSLVLAPRLWQQFTAALKYRPTAAQERVIAQIHADLCESRPMLRLVQGDVGSGKTLVAAAAALAALSSGGQVAVVAPTEILAEQHFQQFQSWFTPLGFQVGWLVGKLGAAQKRKELENIANSSTQLVVGTHALLEDPVEFAGLGLVIIDEQHRFGVHQRLRLRNKSAFDTPHQLVMTATPIPRTLAMTAYADLDLSVIDELPPGRTPVTTVLVSQGRKDEVITRIDNACRDGRQAYWVCTLVEDSESLAAAAAEATVEELRALLPHLNIGLVHGRLKARQKSETMSAFKSGEMQLLVATTVIEVGVDVPNASLMVIENPERLGLAQLHQLRGRVGRGTEASYCVLLYGEKLSQLARQRLQVLRDNRDGFAIAEEDLAIRGPGELLGTRQTGEMNFRLADLQRDAALMPSVMETASQLEHHHPNLVAAIIQRWFANHEQYLQG